MTIFRRRTGAAWRVLGGSAVLPVAPSAPRATGATPADGAAAVAWEPAFAGGTPITGYTIHAEPGGFTASAGALATSGTISGLTNATVYTITVTATNAIGTGAASNAVSVTPTAGVLVKPDATNTGIPSGTILTASGTLDVTTSGTVLDGLDITGSLKISASNVTVRNCRITYTGALYALNVLPGLTSVIVQDSEINGGVGNNASAAVLVKSGILRRVNVHGGIDGVKLEGDAMLDASYVHDQDHTDTTKHCDAVQITACTGVTVRRNNLDNFVVTATNLSPSPRVAGNSAVGLGNQTGPLTGLLVEDNWMDGGNYTMFANKGKEATYGAMAGTFQRNRYGLHARFGVGPNGFPTATLTFDSTNVWDVTGTTDTGASVTANTAVR